MAPRLSLWSVLLGAIALVVPGPALAGTIRPNNIADDFGGNPAICSLRESLQAANTNSSFGGCPRPPGPDVVVLQPGGVYYLTETGGQAAGNESGDLNVSGALDGKLTIRVARGGMATVDGNRDFHGNASDGVLNVEAGAQVTLSHLRLRHGAFAPSAGGALGVAAGAELTVARSVVSDNIAEDGGAIVNAGMLRLDRVRMRGNLALSGGALANRPSGQATLTNVTMADNRATLGAGIVNQGDLTVVGTTISANRANGAPTADGGGIYAHQGTAFIRNSTIAENRARDSGGGIHNEAAATVNLNAVTVARNRANSDSSAGGTGGGLSNNAGTFRVTNSLIALNRFGGGQVNNCAGAFTTPGPNLLGTQGPGCAGFSPPDDILTSQPRIGQLRDNGGSTKTIALNPSSPAIGAAGSSAPFRDQRGVKRDADPDIGAFERALQPPSLVGP